MLVLAGVSINAVVGDNGILTKTQYASFLNEMAAVEEAVQLWKTGEVIEANGENTKLIPANGLCRANELSETERLVGEIGYYRIWSMSETQPATNILSDASDFNRDFGSELIFYPAGVQDLYYLNNEALGIKEDKTYLIDASTGMIYSMTGIGLKGVRCYSSNMAKAVMNGESTAPLFAEAEVSGTGNNIVYAGSKYLMDKNGNYVDENGNIVSAENKVENPNGFQIIASTSNKNVYKLYNNGDLYGKGVKGIALNTSPEEMEKVNAGIFQELTFPGIIIGRDKDLDYSTIINSGCKIFEGGNTIFVLNSSGELWAWGDNTGNKLGLTQEQQVEYTCREAIKLDVDGKKVKNVFALSTATYVLTDEDVPRLFAAGANTGDDAGLLGVGHVNSVNSFEQVNFEHPENIIKISRGEGTYILCNDNRMYGTGKLSFLFSGVPAQTSFVSIFNGTLGDNIVSDIKDFVIQRGMLILKKDGTVWSQSTNFWRWMYAVKSYSGTLVQLPDDYGKNVKNIYYCAGWSVLIEKENGDLYFHAGHSGAGLLGTSFNDYVASDENLRNNFLDIKSYLNSELLTNGIKKIIPVLGKGIYFIDNQDNIYVSGVQYICGTNTVSKSLTDGIIKLSDCNSNINNYNVSDITNDVYYPIVILEDGKALSIAESDIIFRDNILQKSWYKMNPEGIKVKSVSLEGYQSNFAFVDTNNNLWIAGNQSATLGVNSTTAEYNNFIMHPDENIKSKVKKICLATHGTYLLTTDNRVYATGENLTYLGFDEKTYQFKLLTENVSNIYFYWYNKFFVGDNVNFIGWNYYSIAPGASGVGSQYVTTLSPVELPTGYSVNDIISMGFGGTTNSYVFLKNGTTQKLFISGLTGGSDKGWNGLPNSVRQFTEMKLNGLAENEYCLKMCYYTDQGGYFITNLGNLYGFGAYNLLGENNTSTDILKIPKKLGLSDVVDVVCGNGWIIAVTSDGKVYGTGSNIYGVLGRWVGVSRGESNSRYRTAFEWVECPELEI